MGEGEGGAGVPRPHLLTASFAFSQDFFAFTAAAEAAAELDNDLLCLSGRFSWLRLGFGLLRGPPRRPLICVSPFTIHESADATASLPPDGPLMAWLRSFGGHMWRPGTFMIFT